jgi:serine/threonine-protein kinase
MSLAPGTRFDHYEVTALIGVGGMGEVYRAVDTDLKRDVALKVLPESLATDPSRLARLQREAELLAALNQLNVAQIYGLERSAGRTALVMELVDGQTLAERIALGKLAVREALDIAGQIASALEAAHERGIVHRDLKPANVKIKPDGTVKVLDFGIAKALDARAISGPHPALTTPTMTEAGVVLGTAAYMSPEQARGQAVDKRADVWAFGCVLYEMLSGRAAFLGEDTTTTLARVLEREPDFGQVPADVPAAVRGTIELCLQKDPRKRLHDMGDVRLALAGGLGALSPRPAEGRPPWRLALPLVAGIAAGALVAGGYFATRRVEAPAAPLPARTTRFLITPPASAPLSNVGGYDMTISPGGERIAYFAETREPGQFTLHVRELDALEAREIPGTEVSGGTMNLFFSPDGKNVGFFVPERGLIRVGLDGAPPLKIMDPPEPVFLGAAWAEDDTIIVSTGQTLQRVPAGGGVPEALTQPDETRLLASPALLPGGRALLFGEIEGGAERIAVLDLSTRERKVLIEGAQVPYYAATGHLVFARGTTLMAAPFDLAELAVTGEAVALVQNVRHPSTQTAADFALSASGTLAYVRSGDETSEVGEVGWVNRAGNTTALAVSTVVNNPRDPSLSPDGTRLALTTGPDNNGNVWIYDLRGRPPIPLATGNGGRTPVWSPDSRQVAFGVPNGAFVADIYTLPADGSALSPVPISAGRNRGYPRVWSAAGEILSVGPPFDSTKLRALPAAGDAEVREITRAQYREMDPALSPDGRWLAYASNRSGRDEVWIQAYPSGVPVRISTNGGFEPRWSADGRELFYIQGNSLMDVAVEAGAELSFEPPVQLFGGFFFTSADPFVSSYDVARDGRFVMIGLRDSGEAGASSSIVVVENWTRELARLVPSPR